MAVGLLFECSQTPKADFLVVLHVTIRSDKRRSGMLAAVTAAILQPNLSAHLATTEDHVDSISSQDEL